MADTSKSGTLTAPRVGVDETVSWSSDSSAIGGEISEENLEIEIRELILKTNIMLENFANDESLQKKLFLGSLEIAMGHWTGLKRLNKQEAARLKDNRDVMYVFSKLTSLTLYANN